MKLTIITKTILFNKISNLKRSNKQEIIPFDLNLNSIDQFYSKQILEQKLSIQNENIKNSIFFKKMFEHKNNEFYIEKEQEKKLR